MFQGQVETDEAVPVTMVRDALWQPALLRWLIMDMNSFFASVEQYDAPHLRGKPVAVVPMLTDSTCAIAASYEAKAFGIKTGTPVWEAKAKCPNLKIVMARHQRYVEVHHQVAAAIARVLPIHSRGSIDEFACHLLNNENSPDRARALAAAIKAELQKEFDGAIRGSIGIGPNHWLAKVASDMQKPDGLTILRAEDLPGPLLKLQLQDLNGIGENMRLRLFDAGIYTVEKLYHTPPKLLRQIWGNVGGESFWYRLHGYPLPLLEVGDKRVIGHSRVLEPALRPPPLARLVARRLLCKAATRLRRYDLTTAMLSLSVRDAVRGRWGAARKITRSDDSFALLSELQVLWQAMLLQLRPGVIKKIAVSLTDLAAPATAADLWTTARVQKRAQVLPWLDALNQKWGRDTITIGALPPDKIETKIAFARIPDIEEFWE
jgi:DNA polymerase-4